jgi:hypothetical protein
MSSRSSKTVWVALAAGALLSLGLSANALAESKWDKQHPRRDQVNDRLAHQNARIKRDRQIRREERLMAGQNGGHITKQEQKTLNQQENAVSKKIGE